MQLHLQDIARVVLFRNRAKPAQVRIASDDVENMALKLLDAAREPLETMASILKKHHVSKEGFALYANLADLPGVLKTELLEEDETAYNAAKGEFEVIIYREGTLAEVSQRAFKIFERKYLR